MLHRYDGAYPEEFAKTHTDLERLFSIVSGARTIAKKYEDLAAVRGLHKEECHLTGLVDGYNYVLELISKLHNGQAIE